MTESLTVITVVAGRSPWLEAIDRFIDTHQAQLRRVQASNPGAGQRYEESLYALEALRRACKSRNALSRIQAPQRRALEQAMFAVKGAAVRTFAREMLRQRGMGTTAAHRALRRRE